LGVRSCVHLENYLKNEYIQINRGFGSSFSHNNSPTQNMEDQIVRR
jgi:hypothetical protein